jgi:hypothetical protein
MRHKRLWSILPLIMFASSAHAGGWISGEVDQVQSFTGHTGLLIRLKSAPQNPDNCPSSSFYIYPDNAPRATLVQSMLLSAQASGKRVEIFVDGCYENYPRIIHVSTFS